MSVIKPFNTIPIFFKIFDELIGITQKKIIKRNYAVFISQKKLIILGTMAVILDLSKVSDET